MKSIFMGFVFSDTETYHFHNLLISSRVLPLVSGTIFHTNTADSTDITPYKT